MKILLVVKSKAIETLGPMYLSSIAKQAGHECKIVDIDEAFNKAIRYKPDIIGYSILTGDQKRFKTLNKSLKQVIPFIAIIGGPHGTFFPQDFIGGEEYYMVIPGEAEQKWAELLGADFQYSDIDSIPWPDRTDFPKMKIRDFITTRGCPFSCSYCYNDRWAKMFPEISRVRTRSVVDVIEEINNVNPEFVYFQDSCFGISMEWLQEFSHKYRRFVNIPFHVHLRPSQVNKERVALLADARCMSVRIALETASEKLRGILNRSNTHLNQIHDAVRLLKKWDIKLMTQNMIGIPDGTIEEDLETLEFNIKCKPAYGWVSIFCPYPGTELGDRCKKEGWYTGDYSEISDCFFDTSVLNFTPEYIEQLECLQKIFALCVEVEYIPKVEELRHENFPKLVHKIMRSQGDGRLYGGIL